MEQGTYGLSSIPGGPISFSGNGELSFLGIYNAHVSFHGSIQDPTNENTAGALTIKARKGLLFVNLIGGAGNVDPGVFALDYDVTGGTKAYRGASGSGLASFSLGPPQEQVQSQGGSLSIWFLGAYML
jgi:hypothetical protein